MEESTAYAEALEQFQDSNKIEQEIEIIDIKEAALIRLRNKIKRLKVQAREINDFKEIKDAWKTTTGEYAIGDFNGKPQGDNGV